MSTEAEDQAERAKREAERIEKAAAEFKRDTQATTTRQGMAKDQLEVSPLSQSYEARQKADALVEQRMAASRSEAEKIQRANRDDNVKAAALAAESNKHEKARQEREALKAAALAEKTRSDPSSYRSFAKEAATRSPPSVGREQQAVAGREQQAAEGRTQQAAHEQAMQRYAQLREAGRTNYQPLRDQSDGAQRLAARQTDKPGQEETEKRASLRANGGKDKDKDGMER